MISLKNYTSDLHFFAKFKNGCFEKSATIEKFTSKSFAFVKLKQGVDVGRSRLVFLAALCEIKTTIIVVFGLFFIFVQFVEFTIKVLRKSITPKSLKGPPFRFKRYLFGLQALCRFFLAFSHFSSISSFHRKTQGCNRGVRRRG